MADADAGDRPFRLREAFHAVGRGAGGEISADCPFHAGCDRRSRCGSEAASGADISRHPCKSARHATGTIAAPQRIRGSLGLPHRLSGASGETDKGKEVPADALPDADAFKALRRAFDARHVALGLLRTLPSVRDQVQDHLETHVAHGKPNLSEGRPRGLEDAREAYHPLRWPGSAVQAIFMWSTISDRCPVDGPHHPQPRSRPNEPRRPEGLRWL